ncbi:MAG: TetR/AcrR family transcriptional regulator [Nevskiaceae bacterium]|nr:MAG: TetR/AcrR family transcriptional regulator [Nevskiaceae bacterium]TBR71380.1 MAG: TetR/AcrR family transcriptional regulator [Nevskiaceae bacterium]
MPHQHARHASMSHAESSGESRRSAATRRMPRAEREAQMLEAAARLFGEKGFAVTSMDDIARACGVTKPMLYAYFGSKDGLYKAMINRAGQHLVQSVVGVIREADPMTRLRYAVEQFLRFVDGHRDSWRMVFAGGANDGGPEVLAYRQQILAAATITLSQLGTGGLPAATAQALARPYAHALLGAVEAIAHWWVTTPGVPLEAAQRIGARGLQGIADAAVLELAAVAPPGTPNG